MSYRAVITHIGANTPLGDRIGMSAAMYYAGISQYGQHPYIKNAEDDPVSVCLVEYLEDYRTISERMASLLIGALQEIPKVGDIPCLIAFPEWNKRPGLLFEKNPDRQVAELVDKRLPGFDERCRFIYGDHSIGHQLLHNALEKLDTGEWDACIIGGVDSYLVRDTIRWLEKSKMLHCKGNPNGLTPGEGAACYLVTTENYANREDWKPLAGIIGVSCDTEQFPFESEDVGTAKGLRNAIRTSCISLTDDQDKIRQAYCDMNGDRERANELGFLLPQVKDYLENELILEMPATAWGDLGACTSPALVGLAIASSQLGHAHGNRTMVWCSSQQNHRGALYLEYMDSKTKGELWQ